MLFFIFIPGTLAAALVFSPNLRAGLFYATAQSFNWLLGAASYFPLPSLGPIYYEPAAFAAAPVHGVTQLQELLLDQRTAFLPTRARARRRASRAFASLHVSIFLTGALAAHMLGPRPAREDARLGDARADRRSRRSTSAGTTCSTTSAASSRRAGAHRSRAR